MNHDARQLGVNVESVSKALAEWTVSQMSDADPTLGQRYGERWRRSWVGEVTQLLAHLSQALAVGRPEIVRLSVAWSAQAFAARGAERDDLKRMLACLVEIVGARLPDPTGTAKSYLENAGTVLDEVVAAAEPLFDVGSHDGMLVLQYLEAILQGQRADAERLVLDAARNGRPVADIHDRLLQPALAEMGRMWHANEITIADEHFATIVTEDLIARLRQVSTPAASNGRCAVTTTVAGELHGVGVHMFSDLLELDGWRVIPLGANMPQQDVVVCLDTHEADLLAVSVTSFLNLRSAADLIAAVRARGLEAVKILVGGGPFRLVEGLWEDLGADGCARTAGEGVASASRLVNG